MRTKATNLNSDRVIHLEPNETMKTKRYRNQFKEDAHLVHDAIRREPGISGKNAIAAATNLEPARVSLVLKGIQSGDLGLTHVEYGSVRYRGEVKTGWFALDQRRHHVLLSQGEAHSKIVEQGVHNGRIRRLIRSLGIPGADSFVLEILQSLGIKDLSVLNEEDMQAIEELIAEEATTPRV